MGGTQRLAAFSPARSTIKQASSASRIAPSGAIAPALSWSAIEPVLRPAPIASVAALAVLAAAPMVASIPLAAVGAAIAVRAARITSATAEKFLTGGTVAALQRVLPNGPAWDAI